MKYSLAIAALLSSTDARREKRQVLNSIRNEIQHDGQIKHPKVKSTNNCSATVDRLKAGPANIPEVIHLKTQYVDTSFQTGDALYGGSSNTQFTSFESTVKSDLYNGSMEWKRWPEVFSPTTTSANVITGSNGTILEEIDPEQGQLGDCWWIASSAAFAGHPNAANQVITQKFNTAGIYAFKFYVRGIPWVIDVDGSLLKYYSNFAYGGVNLTTKAIWSALAEKALAKLKGSYAAAAGGFNQTGLSLWTGVPVLSYSGSSVSNTTDADAVWDAVVTGQASGYVMTAGSAGGGNDQVNNSCGIAMSHAYSIFGAFTLDNNGTPEKVYLARNPWGTTTYTGTWKHDSALWTDANKAEVPYSLSGDVTSKTNGYFVIEASKLINSECFDGIDIAKSMIGYMDTRYDYENSPTLPDDMTTYYQFEFTTPMVDGDFYVSTYIYEDMVIPQTTECQTSGKLPLVDQETFRGGTKLGYKYYMYQFSKPWLVPVSDQTEPNGSIYTVGINIQWLQNGLTPQDFTVKVYSKHSNMPIHLKTSNANVKTNYDGSTPSAFTCSNYLGMGNCSGGTNECASWTSSGTPMSGCSSDTCSLCSNYDPSADPTPVTPTPVTPTPTPYYPTVVPVVPTPTESNSGDNFDPETYEATSLLDLFETGCTVSQFFDVIFSGNFWVLFVWF